MILPFLLMGGKKPVSTRLGQFLTVGSSKLNGCQSMGPDFLQVENLYNKPSGDGEVMPGHLHWSKQISCPEIDAFPGMALLKNGTKL